MRIKLNTSNLPDEIVFCRHAESVGNAREEDDMSLPDLANHLFDLSPKGIAQATRAGKILKELYPSGFDDYYISTFYRTRATFKLLYPEIEPYEDPCLDEWWKGIFHSLEEDDIRKFYSKESGVLEREGWYHYQPPQGESGKQVEVRILNFLLRLPRVEKIFICGHGRWFCFFERILCGASRDEMRKTPIGNSSMLSFKKDSDIYIATPVYGS